MKWFILGLCILGLGCQSPPPDISKATLSYPRQLHTTRTEPIQVIRDQEYILIVNSTAHSFETSDLWINQQYTHALPAIPAGSTLRVNLWDCYDDLGDQFNAGGVWRTDDPTKLVLAQLQLGEESPLVSLLVIGEN
tara:strand:- start:55 stop:462 length:408 start_codon:yes stop_codon:yes gene_type:complete